MNWSRLSPSIHNSLWPCSLGISTLGLTSSLIFTLNTGCTTPLFIILPLFCFCILSWSNNIIWEANSGEYSLQTLDNLNFSFCLFVFSEIILFFSLFWAFFHFSLSPSIFIGHSWPPLGIETINPIGLPLFNTILLISSGISVTWGHHLIMIGNSNGAISGISLTLILGSLFLINQYLELNRAPFSISDSVYGSIFLTLTGLHGFHVFIGVLLLTISSLRLIENDFSSINHVGIELSIWYWHLVDCIWLIVYSLLYWWSS